MLWTALEPWKTQMLVPDRILLTNRLQLVDLLTRMVLTKNWFPPGRGHFEDRAGPVNS